jgi:hypothetical protein
MRRSMLVGSLKNTGKVIFVKSLAILCLMMLQRLDAPKTRRWPIVTLQVELLTHNSVSVVLTLVNVLGQEGF